MTDTNAAGSFYVTLDSNDNMWKQLFDVEQSSDLHRYGVIIVQENAKRKFNIRQVYKLISVVTNNVIGYMVGY